MTIRLPIHPVGRLLSGVPPELRANVTHYYLDISWWGLYAGATAAFLAIYAARVGATPAQIGLITALPAGMQLLIALPFGGIVRRMNAHRATYLGAFISRMMFLLYAFLPFLPAEHLQINAIIGLSLLIAVPTTLIGISFPQLLMEAIPPDWRGTVVSVRNALFSIISFIVTVISGQLLTRLPFPVNYQVVFVIGFIGGVMTAVQLWRVRPLESLRGHTTPLAAAGAGRRFSLNLRRLVPPMTDQGRRYIRVLILLFLFNTTNNTIAPLVPGILVHRLNLSDAWISIGTALNSMILFLVSLYFARRRLKISSRQGTSLGAGLLAVQAVLLAAAVDQWTYLLSVVVGGLGSGVLLTSQFNYHLENVPDHERAGWLSWNLLMGNAALLIGALGGPQVAALTGIPTALTVFGVLRLVMALAILRLG